MKFLSKLLGASVFASPTLGLAVLEDTYEEDVLEAPRSTRYPKVVEEIHHAFNTAGDKLLAEAQAVINGTDESSFAKAERLAKLGFTSVKQVTEVATVKAELSAKKQMQQLLTEYAIKYPTYRFIDEAGVKAICEKYSLVFGDISLYKGFVPEKNLAEIERFPGVKEDDAVYQKRYIYGNGNLGHWTTDYEATPQHQDMLRRGDAYSWHVVGMSDYSNYERRSSNSYLICAPIKDMNMEGKQQIGHRILNKHVPDPVVLVPVKGDLFIILTAWGDEAQDPLVAKGNLN